MSEAIPPIESAFLNIATVITDCNAASDAWEDENWKDCEMWLRQAANQIESAMIKISRHRGLYVDVINVSKGKKETDEVC